MSAYTLLKEKLTEIFQLDRGDLDFGLYRIMNQKREEITEFLDEQLLPQVKEILVAANPDNNDKVKAELESTLKTLDEMGVDPETSTKVRELKAKMSASVDLTKLENEIYSDLYNFFRRYYSDGDFMSLRRYKEGVYAMPYEGEEVKLHWANHDQYYIKTAENLNNYTFKPQGKDGKQKTVRFELASADTEKNNNKSTEGKERRFLLHEENPLTVTGDSMIIRFEYRADSEKRKQEKLNEEIALALIDRAEIEAFGLKSLAPTEKKKERTLLEKHLTDFTAKNSFDYFIHKDLGKFLRRELDFYIKNEIMHLDDIESEDAPKVETYLTKIRALRKVAGKLITFLAHLEDFQKKLWLKKKFVLESHYCITIDQILKREDADEVLAIICENEEQRKEWIELFKIDENTPITTDFLRANDKLQLDTKFYDTAFKYRLLSGFDDLDQQTDGLMINSENFQALNLMQERYREKLKCIYIDPPYNTGNDGFNYKDGYRSSSWLALMNDRVNKSHSFLKNEGVKFISNDDNENHHLRKLVEENGYKFKTNMIWNTDGHTDNQFEIKVNHEYVSLIQKSSEAVYGNVIDPNTRKESNLWDNVAENSITKNGEKNPYSSVTLPVGFPVKGKSGKIEKNTPDDAFFSAIEGQDYFDRTNIKKFKVKFPIRLHDVEYAEGALTKEAQVLAGWANLNKLKKFIKNECKPYLDGEDLMYFYLSDSGTVYYRKEKVSSRNILSVLKNFKTTEKMKYELEGMDINFKYPKPDDILSYLLKIGESNLTLDYFAGSGTTGHATINLNREDKGERKYILVEMGEYFNSVTKPRVQKVAYSKEWKDGMPQPTASDNDQLLMVNDECASSKRFSGVSHVMKYMSLEQYEDTLDNLVVDKTEGQASLLAENPTLKEDYLLSYMMEFESKESLLNLDGFASPYDYTLRITRDDDTQLVKVDLVETFNYLLGLEVKTIDLSSKTGILTITGVNSLGEKCLILWREIAKVNSEQLDKWFTDRYSSRDLEFDAIYVNGDNHIENLKTNDDRWKVRMIEIEFQKLMFAETV